MILIYSVVQLVKADDARFVTLTTRVRSSAGLFFIYQRPNCGGKCRGAPLDPRPIPPPLRPVGARPITDAIDSLRGDPTGDCDRGVSEIMPPLASGGGDNGRPSGILKVAATTDSCEDAGEISSTGDCGALGTCGI